MEKHQLKKFVLEVAEYFKPETLLCGRICLCHVPGMPHWSGHVDVFDDETALKAERQQFPTEEDARAWGRTQQVMMKKRGMRRIQIPLSKQAEDELAAAIIQAENEEAEFQAHVDRTEGLCDDVQVEADQDDVDWHLLQVMDRVDYYDQVFDMPPPPTEAPRRSTPGSPGFTTWTPLMPTLGLDSWTALMEVSSPPVVASPEPGLHSLPALTALWDWFVGKLRTSPANAPFIDTVSQ